MADDRSSVNDSPQPVVVMNDLKHGDSEGAVALWIGLGTEAFVANLQLLKCLTFTAPLLPTLHNYRNS